MNGEEALAAVIDALEAMGIPYMLVGSLSSNFYGVPRATEDADLVVHLGATSLGRIRDALGSRFYVDPQMTFETVTGTTRYALRSVDTRFEIEMFLLSPDQYDQERFRRRRRVRLLERETYMPSVEDVIVTKLRWGSQGRRNKDINDVRGVIALQQAQVDWDYVHHWCDRHGTRPLLEEIRRQIPM